MKNEKSSARLERCLERVKQSPDSAVAHFNLGLSYTQRGHMERAEKAYRQALAIDPELVEAWVNLGGALLLKWDFEGALEANQEALKRQDDSLLAHFNMGQAYLYLSNAEGLVRSCRRVIELDPNHAAGHYFLAVGLLASSQVEEARTALAHSMELGHRPTPEFLRGLERAETENNLKAENIVTDIGAEAPQKSKEK